MALQIRRGTNAERILITPLPGELIYVTDYLTAPPGTNAVYVGDGSTAGGIPVAVTPALAGTLAGNINLGGNQINGTGTISITGNITNTGTLTTNGNIVGTGNISRTGNLTINGDGAVTGNLSAGSFEGELRGSVFADDSSGPLVDAITSSFNGDKLTINDIDGSTVEFVRNSIIYNNVNPNLSLSIGNATSTLGINFFLDKPITLNVAIDPDGDFSNAASITTVVSRGTVPEPTNIQPNDILAGTLTSAYSNDSLGIAGFMQLIAEDQTGAAPGVAPASWVLGTGTLARDVVLGAGSAFDRGNLVFSSNNILSVPVLKVASYDFATPGDFDVTPAAGMIVFDTDTNEFKGYNGTTWVVLG